MPKPIKQKKGQKHSWISKQDRNGWSLGFAIGPKTYWLTNFRFSNEEAVEKAFGSKIVFVHLKDLK